MPRGLQADKPYGRAVELAMKGAHSGYGVRYPDAVGYSMLEFGVAGGRTLKKLLEHRDHWRRALGFIKPVTVLGFDTFEGLPPERDSADIGPWRVGQFAASRETVLRLIKAHNNVRLIKGLFSETI